MVLIVARVACFTFFREECVRRACSPTNAAATDTGYSFDMSAGMTWLSVICCFDHDLSPSVAACMARM